MAKRKRITLNDVMNKLNRMEGEFQDLKGKIQDLKEEVQDLRGKVRDLRGKVRDLRKEMYDFRGEIQNLKVFIWTVPQRNGRRKGSYWADTIGVGSSVHGPTYLDPRILKD